MTDGCEQQKGSSINDDLRIERLKEEEDPGPFQYERKREGGAGVDGRLQDSRTEWLGAVHSEPGFADAELGALIQEFQPWALGKPETVLYEKTIIIGLRECIIGEELRLKMCLWKMNGEMGLKQ